MKKKKLGKKEKGIKIHWSTKLYIEQILSDHEKKMNKRKMQQTKKITKPLTYT